MDHNNADLNRQLGDWLREASATRAPGRLVEDVFARTSRTRQARRLWPPTSLLRSRQEAWHVLRLAAAGVVVVAVTVALSRLIPDQGVGMLPTPTPTETRVPDPTPLAPLPSPRVTTVDGAAALVVRLGADAGPIDVVEAYGSIWTANIHSNDVSRLVPTSLEQTARIPTGIGPAWFSVAGDALIVSNQMGSGLTLIDPDTNTKLAAMGDARPCGAPVVAFESLWASACDSGVILRIDLTDIADITAGTRFPSASELVTEIPAQGYRWLAFVDGRLFTGNAAGLAEVNPTAETVVDLGFCCGDVMGSDGQTIWLNRATDVARMDPSNEAILATFPYANAGAVTFADGRAWLTASGTGVIEIDLASNEVVRTFPVPGSTLVAREAAGVLWVTSFDTSELWRIEP